MAGKDQFADLFHSTLSKKDDSKLTLAERQKLASDSSNLSINNQSSSNNWADFDILSRSSSAKPGQTSAGKNTPTNDPNHLFEGFNSIKNSTTVTNNKPPANDELLESFGLSSSSLSAQQQVHSSNFNEFDLLDGMATTPASDPQPKPNTQDLDDLFSVFDQPQRPTPLENPKPVNTGKTSTLINNGKPNGPKETLESSNNDDARDEAIASLVDMGFDVDQANKALDHTSTGVDVQEAISYILNSAHRKSRAKQAPQTEREGPQYPYGSNPAATSVFGGKNAEQYLNKFSSIFESVSHKVANEAAKFFDAPNVTSDGRPAWMRNQAQYKSRNGNYEEDPEELDEETIRRLTLQENEKRRQRDQERRRERNRMPHPPRADTSSEPIPPTRPRRQVDRPHSTRPAQPIPSQIPHQEDPPRVPVPVLSKQKPTEPEVDLFSPAPSTRPVFDNNEMISSSRRRSKQSTPTSKTKTLRTGAPISSTQRGFFDDSRKQGGVYFKAGDFTTALTHYLQALDALPHNHPLRIIAYSNCITAYFKVGENKKVIELSELANDLIGPNRGNDEEVEVGKPIKDFWIKINTKKAEAFEHLEKFEDSLSVWNELIENGAANKVSLDGKRRCQMFLAPKPKPATPKPSAPSQTSIHLRKPEPGPRPDSVTVKRVQEFKKADEQFEQDKFRLYDQVEQKVNEWKNSKEDNLRALLSSLHVILWESANWKPVNMSDLVMPKKVKIVYLKAVSKVHPDKIPQNATSEQKLIAQNVFVVINQAWEAFKAQNGIQ